MQQRCKDDAGPKWISSLEAVLKLKPEWMFDAHGSIFSGAEEVERQLGRNLDFLMAIRDRVHQRATHGQSIQQLTRKGF